MAVSIDSVILEQLDTTEARALHDVEAKLSACGVARIVNLPRLVVVGDQSAGKSSVLEAISHVRFPVEGGLCTRFATELILTQAPNTYVDVSVKFADSTKPSKSFQRTGFKEDDLPDIIREAKEYMGLSALGKEFSKDVLRLEIGGPDMCHLTLIDLPGFFNSNTATQTLFGKAMVNDIVEGYMSQENSIILVVIDAATQLARQESLLRVQKTDPTRERTIGVITKPDRTSPGTFDETAYVQVAKNQESAHKLKHGWHVLRNRGDNEISLDERDDIEERFFKSGAWATIPRKDLGIANLRKKLSEIRYAHLRKHLPGVVDEIESKLEERQQELTQLGQSRLTDGEKRSFLLRIAMDYQRLARDGVYGLYNDPFFGGLDDGRRKLRAIVRNLGRAFDYVMRTKGCKQTIVFPTEDGVTSTWIGKDENRLVQYEVPLDYLDSFLDSHPYNFPDPEIVTEAHLNVQLQRQASDNRGSEFPGLPNHEMTIKLFQSQSEPWRHITEVHIDHVVNVVEGFVTELFEHIAGPSGTNRATDAILSAYVDRYFDEKKKVLRNKLNELLRPYEEGFALPVDRELLMAMKQRQVATDTEEEEGSRTPDIDEFGTRKVVDMMLAYYEVCRRTFTDNVVNLAIESCLIRDLPNIFTPTEVGNMDKAQLDELAAESAESRSRREQLEADVKVLQQGLAQCRKYRIRTTANGVSNPSTPTPKKLMAPPSDVPKVPFKIESASQTVPLPASIFAKPNPSLATTQNVPIRPASSTPPLPGASSSSAFGVNPAATPVQGAPAQAQSGIAPAKPAPTFGGFGGFGGAPPASSSTFHSFGQQQQSPFGLAKADQKPLPFQSANGVAPKGLLVGSKWVKPEPSQFSTYKSGMFTPVSAESDTWLEAHEGTAPSPVRFNGLWFKFPHITKSPEEHRLEFYSNYVKA